MELKPGQWRLTIWEVWKGQSVWWWDGCVGCPWKIESAVRIYATFLVLPNRVADVARCGRLRWFGHLERKSVDDWVSSCRRLVVEGVRAGVVRKCMSRFLHIPPEEPSATPLLDKKIQENRVRSSFLVVPGVHFFIAIQRYSSYCRSPHVTGFS